MRSKGKITTWHDDKGFGFVTPFDGSKQVFIHIKAFRNRNRRPQINDVVTFSMSTDQQRRPCAANAVLAGDKLKPKAPNQSSTPAIAVAVLFFAAVGASVALNQLPLIVGIAYAVLSLITFMAYAWDKTAARSGGWRTAESTLHLLGLFGGWPGALIAQQTLRHKSKKGSFVAVLWATVLINGGAFVWLQTEDGQAALEAFLR
jgi:uncharacterized membrane protein YsdA (DUF1294 family)/cold shock CspA family protein